MSDVRFWEPWEICDMVQRFERGPDEFVDAKEYRLLRTYVETLRDSRESPPTRAEVGDFDEKQINTWAHELAELTTDYRNDQNIVGAFEDWLGMLFATIKRRESPQGFGREQLRKHLQYMIAEAEQHLGMYVRSYKREPYDTGSMLAIYINEANERIAQAKQALKLMASPESGKETK